tara:strand:- start:1595 stop:1801 length:207 start_codon:yes stop_codon:yes gene_type:complete
MPAKKKVSVKPVDKKFDNIEIHELNIRMENVEAKVEECYKKMNRALSQLNALTTMLPKIKKCCDRLGI